MSFFSRVFHGGVRALTAGVRAAITPFTFLWNQGKTILKTLNDVVHLRLGSAVKELVGGTVKNTVRAGVNLVEGGMPLLAFGEGFARDKGGISLT